MDDTAKKALMAAGINLETGIQRFLDDEQLYESFLVRFVEDDAFEKMTAGVRKNNVQEAFMAAHTLKGVAANLSIDSINEVLNPIVEILRAGSLDGVREGIEELRPVYEKVVKTIRLYL